MIDNDEGAASAVSTARNRTVEDGCRLVDVEFVVDGEGVLVLFHAIANPKLQAAPNRNFVSRCMNTNELLLYDEDGKGIFCWACRDANMDFIWGLKLCTALRKSRVTDHAAIARHITNVAQQENYVWKSLWLCGHCFIVWPEAKRPTTLLWPSGRPDLRPVAVDV